MSESTAEEFVIEHFGVKGMKWGVRKDRSARKDRGGEKTKYGKSPARLSDAELRRRISRMELEKQYLELNPKKTNKAAAGSLFVAKKLGSIGGQAVAKVATDALAGAMKTVLESKLKKK